MAIAGTWRANSVTPVEYDGATRWGTGINAVHSLYDEHKPTATKEPLGSTGWSGAPPEEILGPVMWGYQVEDQQLYGGEDYRYVAADHPVWGEDENLGNRPDRDGGIMQVGVEPQPEGWPAWGPANDSSDSSGDFPLTGPPAGAAVRAHSDGSDVENNRAIAVPTRGYTGGWLSKERGDLATNPGISDPAQYTITTSMVQGQGAKALDNVSAVTRVTDDARSPIQSRTAGMRVRHYAKSEGMGGGPGTPDMYPRQQDLPFRPFFFRQGAMPPMEEHTWNEVMYNTPIERNVPQDAGEYVTVQDNASQDNYGFTTEDGSYY